MRTDRKPLFIGTYSKLGSKHLYTCDFDEKTGQFGQLKPVAALEQTSYLVETPDKLVTICRQEQNGGLAVLDSDGHVISTQVEAGPAPCYVSYDDARQMIYTANYHTGTIAAYQLLSTGDLQLLDRLHLGENSHPHYINLTADQLLVVCDLGQDQLLTYQLNNNHFQLLSQHHLPKRTGPRHLVFNPKNKATYVLGEKDNALHTLFYDGYGEFCHYSSHSVLPQDTEQTSAAAALAISSCGHYLYVSNRGQDSITCFSLGADGIPTTLSHYQLDGKIPRDICISQTGNHLIVACQDSNHVYSLAIDPKNGELSTCHHLEVPEPVALLMSKAEKE